MKKEGNLLGLKSCIGILVGGMIGSAIFSLTGLTILNAGASALLSWSIAAVMMLGYGLIVAELATIYPKSGGVYVFPAKSLGTKEETGKFWGWISAWGFIISNIVAVAFSAIYVGIYLGVGFPVFENNQVIIAVVSILLVLAINIMKLSTMKKIDVIMVIFLIITLATYAIVSLTSSSWDSSMLVPFFTQGEMGSTGFLTSVPTAMVGYGSIVTISFMVSKVKNPKKNVPKSAVISMGIVFLLYFLVILATVGMISSQYLKDNPGMQFIPLYAVAFTKLTALPWFSKLISISAVLALLTTMIAVMAVTSTAIVAVSGKDGILPNKLSAKNKNGTNIYAVLLVAIISLVISCFPSLVTNLVEFAALFAAVTIVINCISLIQARKKNEYKEGSFRVFGKSFVPILIMILIVICYIPDIIKGGWQLWAYTIAWYIVGIVMYILRVRKKNQV
ncbi:MAG: APC family permease [Clostridia bacterium]|nr:APC family permease [Clostridia bacterium]